MIPIKFPEANAILAANQDEYEPIYVHRDDGPEGIVTCAFKLSPGELTEIATTKTIWLQLLTFGHPFQPVRLSTKRPFE